MARYPSTVSLLFSTLALAPTLALAAAPTTTTVASSLNPSFTAQPFVLTATVTAQATAPSGVVTFLDGAVAIPGCAGVPLEGVGALNSAGVPLNSAGVPLHSADVSQAASGTQRQAACAVSGLAPAAHTITASYSGDGDNAASSGQVVQYVLTVTPSGATIAANPFGAVTVQGTTLSGNTLGTFFGSAVIQLGPVPGPGVFEVDFPALNLGPGTSITFRAGAPDQAVLVRHQGAMTPILAGALVAQGFTVGAPPLRLESATGVTLYPTGTIAGDEVAVDTLGATWTTGAPIVNAGGIHAGRKLELLASRITGSGTFKGDAIVIHTFGNANNPVNGSHFLDNGLALAPGTGDPLPKVYLTLNLYGAAPQVVNLRVQGHASVWMPSAWPQPYDWPANNAVVPPGGTRDPGVPDPAYGGGSLLLQATGQLALSDGGPEGTRDFAFPGGIALRAGEGMDLAGVTLNQGWTTSGVPFQGVFLEAPWITSSSDIRVFSNDLNWTNLSVLADVPLHVQRLIRNVADAAIYVQADRTAPHLNTYSTLVNAAAEGACWICLVNTQPVDMTGR